MGCSSAGRTGGRWIELGHRWPQNRVGPWQAVEFLGPCRSRDIEQLGRHLNVRQDFAVNAVTPFQLLVGRLETN